MPNSDSSPERPDTRSNQIDGTSNKNSKSNKTKSSSVSNLKLINTTSGVRVSQACDRCRIKKIKCDGLTPCHNCSKISFDCKTSDKLTRRAFPKGYTENLEQKLKEAEEENRQLKIRYNLPVEPPSLDAGPSSESNHDSKSFKSEFDTFKHNTTTNATNNQVTLTTNENTTVQINNPIDQIFNLDNKGIIIGNDNLNFESQFNHLLINLNLPFLKITNSHNYLLNDPDSYLYHPSYTMYNQFHNRDLEIIYNPLTVNSSEHNDIIGNMSELTNNQLPRDVYDLFIKLINNFKKIFNNKKELDNQIIHFFLNYNTFIPIFDYRQFMESYDAFHTMYPFMFTYDDATINGFNILSNDYHVVNAYLMVVIQIYAMIMMNDPTINLNLLLNHSNPSYSFSKKIRTDSTQVNESIIRSLYDFLPYFNVFHVSINQLQTYLLFLYYSLLTNNKEKSLVLSSLINSFIGILGINLNSNNLFFNDLSLNIQQKRNRVKIFWVFKVLLKCFNLKFGFKPSLNTTVINPVTIDRYFQLTPEKLSSLLEIDLSTANQFSTGGDLDDLFRTLLKPSVEFLNLINIIIPSSFSPNYYQYLKHDRNGEHTATPQTKKLSNHHHHTKHLDWILNDNDGDGNDGNLNYNFTQFSTIDKNLSNWRASLKDKHFNLIPLQTQMNLPRLSTVQQTNLYHSINSNDDLSASGISQEGLMNYATTELPDIHTASQIIRIQLNFHYLLIRSTNYLNFVIDRELTQHYYTKIANIARETLAYFILIYDHVGNAVQSWDDESNKLSLTNMLGEKYSNTQKTGANNIVMESLGLDVDEDGFVINDFSVKRRKTDTTFNNPLNSQGHLRQQTLSDKRTKQIPTSPFNYMLNGLSMTIINFKKSMVLQMLYLLICSMKISKKGGALETSTTKILLNSVELFMKVYINYKIPSHMNNLNNTKKSKEDELFAKLMNDDLRDEILKEPRNTDESDGEGDIDDNDNDDFNGFDWDDEDMDEDLKYIKVLKFIKYKINALQTKTFMVQERSTKRKSSNSLPQPSQIIHHHHHHHDDELLMPNEQDKFDLNRRSTFQQPMVAPPSISNFQGHLPPPPTITGVNQAPFVNPSGSPMSLSQLGNQQQPITPNLTSFPEMSKIPSITRLDFLLTDDNFPNHTSGSNSFSNTKTFSNIGIPSPGVISDKSRELNNDKNDNDLIKKEKLAINDLMNLKHGHKNSFGNQWGNFPSNASSPNGVGNVRTTSTNPSGHEP